MIVKADTLLREMTSDEKVEATYTGSSLGSYYVKEPKAPDGFVSSMNLNVKGQDVQILKILKLQEDQPTPIESQNQMQQPVRTGWSLSENGNVIEQLDIFQRCTA